MKFCALDFAAVAEQVYAQHLKCCGEISPCGFDSHPRHKLMAELPINKNFFSFWNSKMSYVLGVITADGCVSVKRIRKDGSKQFLLDVSCKDFSLLKRQ